MQFYRFIVLLAIGVATSNAAAVNVERRDISASPLSALESSSFLNRAALSARAASASSLLSQAATAQQVASPELKSQAASLSKLDANTVTADQLTPIISQITSTVKTAGQTYTDLSNQAKAGVSKRQDLNTAVDQLVVDLNNVLKELTPLLKHLTTNLDLGTVQDLVIELTPALTTLILGVEGLLISLAPGLSTIVDPLLVTVYALTDALGINLNLPSP